ncbi:MAG: DNA primase [Desulfobacterales bacterium]|nr:DNA primase [Desulfobacterales bacterium]
MKQRRFSDQQLYTLRNHIPMEVVIEKILCIPSRITQGSLRFQCPLCNKFNTAVNPPTNLARCFACEANFNPIDMVIAVQHTSFVEAVTFLENYQTIPSPDQKQGHKKDRPGPAPAESAWNRSGEKPVAIGNILSGLMDKTDTHSPELCKLGLFSQNTPLAQRIIKLEQDVHLLSEQLHQIKSIICSQK